LENLLNESNAKDRDVEILRKRVMIETNELNQFNSKIEMHTRAQNDKEKFQVSYYLTVDEFIIVPLPRRNKGRDK